MQRAKIVGAVLLALVFAAAWPNAQGDGRAGGAGVKHPNGTLTPNPLDAGRPWGWAAKAFMEDPKRKLYNTAKAKLFSGSRSSAIPKASSIPSSTARWRHTTISPGSRCSTAVAVRRG